MRADKRQSFFAALTDCSPIRLDPFSLTQQDAKFFQTIAWEQYHEDRRREKQPQ